MVTIWGIILVLSLIVEIFTIDLVSIWISLGSLFALILAFFKVSVNIQIIVCIITTVLSFIIIRPLGKEYLRGNIVKTNYDRIIGMVGEVIEEITSNKKGRVLVNGDNWLASSLDNTLIETGKKVEIIYIEGAHVVVKEIKED